MEGARRRVIAQANQSESEGLAHLNLRSHACAWPTCRMWRRRSNRHPGGRNVARVAARAAFEIPGAAVYCAMTTAKEFVDFWLDVSVHADEQEGPRQGQAAVQHLANNLLNAARDQGFSKEQVEAELGDNLEAYIRASIDRQNVAEGVRLRKESK